MMKSVLCTLVVLAAGMCSIEAQTVLLNENFESGAPSGWTNSSLATDGGWLTGNSNTLSSTSFPIPAHTNFAATNDDDCNCNKSADLYMTPVLNLSSSAQVHMSFDVFYADGSYQGAQEDMDIVVSTNGTAGPFVSILDVVGNTTNWYNVFIDLSAYAGMSNVVVGFEYKDANGWLFGAAIDNVVIYEPANYDAAMISENMADYLLLSAAPFTITGTFENKGTATLTAADFNYSVNGGATVTDAGNTINVASLATGTYNHGTGWTPAASGTYTMKAWLSNLNGNADQIPGNDTITWTVNVVDTMVTRNALMEVFTSSTCGPCAPGNANMEDNVVPNISNYTVIKYQQDFPGSGDPYYNSESVGRRNYYAINSIPRMEIDGQWDGNANGLTTTIFNDYQSQPSFMTIDITRAEYFLDADSTVEIDAVIEPLINYPAGTYRYHVVITEKKTVQNVATNGETEFLNVMMKMIPGLSGNTIAALTQNGTINVTKSQSMKGTNVEEMNDLRVVVFVQDNATKKILQSAWMDLTVNGTPNVAENKAGNLQLNAYPNPANNIVTLNFDSEKPGAAHIRILNALGQVVAEENFTARSGANQHSMNVENLTSGVYTISLSGNEGNGSVKVVISR